MTIASDGVAIDGMDFDGGGTLGSGIRGASSLSVHNDLTITNCLLDGYTGQPILFGFGFGGGIGSSGYTITDNLISGISGNNATGIVLFNITDLTLTGNMVVHDDTNLTGRRGINLDGIVNATVQGNSVLEGGPAGTSWGIQIGMSDREASNIDVTGNTVSGSALGIFTLSQRGLSDVSITDNILTTVTNGIVVNSGSVAPVSAGPVFTGVTITGNSIEATDRAVFVRDIHGTNANGPITFDGLVVENNTIVSGIVRLGGSDSLGGLLLNVVGTVTVEGAAGDDRVEVEGTGSVTFDAGAGNDNFIGGSGADSVLGSDGADTLSGGGGDDTLTGGAGDDIITGGAGADSIDAGADDDTIIYGDESELASGEIVDGGDGSDTVVYADADGGTLTLTSDVTNVETFTISNAGAFASVAMGLDASALTGGGVTINGNDAANAITGSAGADAIDGGAGDDVIATGGGSDTVEGGAGTDTVVLAGDRADWTITWNGTTATATDGTDTVTITGVGKISFDDKNVVLVAAGGEHATVQSGVVAAASGDEVLIADGSYAGDVAITDPTISLVAAGSGVNLAGQITVTGVMGAGDVVRLVGLNIDATGKEYGVTVRTSAADIPGVNDGAVEIIGGSIMNARQQGLFYANPSNGSNPVNPDTIGTFVIEGVTFDNNGYYLTGARGQGHINLFGFNGNLTVRDSTFTGPATDQGNPTFRGGSATVPGTTVNPDKAISISGLRTGTTNVGGFVDAGNLVLDNVQITGFYATDALSFYKIQSFASITIDGLDINATAPWALINFDEVSGPVDLSTGFTGVNGAPGNPISQLQGLATDDTFVGSDGSDYLNGRGGADDLSGGAGDDFFGYSSAAEFATGEQVDGGDGTDTILFGSASAETLTLTADVTNIESVVLFTGSTGLGIDASAVGNALSITGNAGANTITGTAFADTVNSGGGNDTVTGGGGNDSVDGGTGTDTFVVTETASFSAAGGVWSVTTTSGGTDSLQNVEIVDDAGSGKVILVGQGGVATIQEALALAGDGDTILIGEGTYSGKFTVTQNNLTIKGVGDPANIVIEGTFETDNGITGSVKDFFETAPSYNNSAGAGITIAGSGVTLQNLTIDSFYVGVELGNGISNVTLTDVDITDTEVGIRKGTAATVTNLTINGGTISDSYQGISFFKAVGAAGRVTGLTIDGTHFDGLGEKGIYLETGSNVSITDIVMNDVGQFGRGPAFGPSSQTGEFGTGIDINLKYDDGTPYSGIVIDGFTFTDVGLSDGPDTWPGDFGAAIAVKARNDASSYNTNPAYYTGAVVIKNGSIVGTSTAIRAGEPGKSVAGPALDVSKVTVSGATVAELDNVTGSLSTVVLTSAAELWRTASTSTGQVDISGGAGYDTIYGGAAADTLSGGNGNDLLEGGAGADVLNGNAGRDTASYSGSDAGVTVDLYLGTATGGHAQGDILALIEDLIGSSLDDRLNGSNAANRLTGDAGNDTIMARNGADSLYGGDGDDLLIGGAGADVLYGGSGTDTASYSSSTAAVTVSLGAVLGVGGDAQGDSLTSIENLIGSNGYGDSLTGNANDNVLSGLGGNDTLNAGNGNDTIIGGMGADRIGVGGGADVVVFQTAAEGGDTVGGFSAADDVFQFVAAGFSGLVAGSDLDVTGQFASNTSGTATQAFGQIVYDSDDGKLYWDADGTGGGAAVLLATVSGAPALTADNFLIV